MTCHMMTTASAVLQLRTQFLRVLLRPIKMVKKPFESLRSATEPRQGAFRHLHDYRLIIYAPACMLPSPPVGLWTLDYGFLTPLDFGLQDFDPMDFGLQGFDPLGLRTSTFGIERRTS